VFLRNLGVRMGILAGIPFVLSREERRSMKHCICSRCLVGVIAVLFEENFAAVSTSIDHTRQLALHEIHFLSILIK
jgi:hypothetical protein